MMMDASFAAQLFVLLSSVFLKVLYISESEFIK